MFARSAGTYRTASCLKSALYAEPKRTNLSILNDKNPYYFGLSGDAGLLPPGREQGDIHCPKGFHPPPLTAFDFCPPVMGGQKDKKNHINPVYPPK
jgi:hypothetical protein